MGGLRARRPTSLKDFDCSNRRAVISSGASLHCYLGKAGWNLRAAFASREVEVSSNILCGGASGQGRGLLSKSQAGLNDRSPESFQAFLGQETRRNSRGGWRQLSLPARADLRTVRREWRGKDDDV